MSGEKNTQPSRASEQPQELPPNVLAEVIQMFREFREEAGSIVNQLKTLKPEVALKVWEILKKDRAQLPDFTHTISALLGSK